MLKGLYTAYKNEKVRRAFLHAEHKTKKLKQQCQVICEKLANLDYERMELEKELRACALLPVQEEPDNGVKSSLGILPGREASDRICPERRRKCAG